MKLTDGELISQLQRTPPQALPSHTHVGPPPGQTIRQAFEEFHDANPRVYTALVRMARQAKVRGATRVGMKMLFEVLRWRALFRTTGDEFKLNNNYHSYYARLIMTQEADLRGLFELRELHTLEDRADG